MYCSQANVEQMVHYIGQPPPGTDLTADQAPKNNGVLTTLVVLATIAVVVRFVVRLKEPQRKLFMDDWCIVVALQPLIALLVIGWIGMLFVSLGILTLTNGHFRKSHGPWEACMVYYSPSLHDTIKGLYSQSTELNHF